MLIQEQGYVIPVGETTPGELEYVTPIDDVQVLPPFVYAELNRNQRQGNDLHQKLSKRDSDYVIPALTEAEPVYEEVGSYKELDITKRGQDRMIALITKN